MIPLIPGRFHQKRGSGAEIVFRRKDGDSYKTKTLPNFLVYVGPHPDQPHLALFKSKIDPDWYYWDIPENVTALDDIPEHSHVGGFRATRPADSLWGRKE